MDDPKFMDFLPYLTFSSVFQILLFAGPWLLPRGLAFYRSIKSANQGPNSVVRPPPPHVQRCLNILFGGVLVCLVLTLPYFSPSNIFKETGSRLGLPTKLLQSRLLALREGNLQPLEKLFLEKMEQAPEKWNAPKDLALLYAAYGPDVVLQCPFCSPEHSNSYLYYALPAIMGWHMIHIFLLGAITSTFVSGSEGARWRTYATIAGVALAAGEFYMTYTYDWEANKQKRALGEVDWFYWKMRMYRQLAFATTDGFLGWFLWLTSTNRWLVKPASITEQLNVATQTLAESYTQINIVSSLRNAIVRDNELRATQEEYWLVNAQETRNMESEREVIDARNIAMSRMDMDRLKGTYDNVLERLFAGL
ncbi:hypothetical protein BLS_009049 [Venturia inaequalis]|uniref:Uncharacterized protein n=1 Tax=Venturia inaequalis TaxID=5025 RepID=A0A8H3Z576_VENIN|nr:hypothetical protein BLS_009049 [Venturia inaequalis]RDI82274.1 hypothetical protein Vi05172_g7674 [Venturia inaequalis]